MKGDAGIHFWAISLNVSVFRSVLMLEFVGEKAGGGGDDHASFNPQNINGAAAFDLRFADAALYHKVTLRFALEDEKGFTVTGKQAEGFVFTS
jgi:hypothetical protein